MQTKTITSLQHPLIQHWVRLRLEAKYRKETKRALITGKNLTKELPLQSLITVEPSRIVAKEKYLVTAEILKKITALSSPDGFAGEVLLPEPSDISQKKALLILDQIADPGNLGTLLRTALALRWEGIIITPGTVDLFNDKVLRAGKGAQFHLPYAEMPPEEIQKLKTHFYLADTKGTYLDKVSFTSPLSLILSNESQGPRPWAVALAEKVTIPMSRQVESLNVAISGAILLYAMRPS